MAGPRANLAVTKDGETYNKLQRPDNFLAEATAVYTANERKRERASDDRVFAKPSSSNKRTKMHHAGFVANKQQLSEDGHQYRSAGPVSECGMRMTLPVDEEEHSDDSMGEALAYLRSVRSEASTIPHLLVASKAHSEDANVSSENPTASTGEHVIYQDGAWISIDEGYEAARTKDHEYDDLGSEELYYMRLMQRFETLRTTLGRFRVYGLAQKSVGKTNQSPSTKPPLNRHEWLYMLDREYPTPVQISQLDEKNIRRGLEYCVYAMDRFDTISGQKGCWIWTLLALSSDIGTLDSRGMSHIRDLGNKAGQLSIDLHQGLKRRNTASDGDLADADTGPGGSEDDTGANKPASYNANGNDCSPGMGSLQVGANEHKDAMTENTPQTLVPGVSELSAAIEGTTNTNTNDSTLECARARLLAQLGDNLVQTGIPTAAYDTNSTPPDRNELLDQGSSDPQHEVKVRPIPSRVEAERQRQMMRVQKSTTELSREAQSLYSESSAMYPVAEENNPCPVDLNTRVTIDMILTVVAERYGQRDLLRYRKPW